MIKSVLVTGGAGYIGSHVCKALAAAGYRPVTVDNLEQGYAWAVQWGPLEQVDVRDGQGLDRVFERYAPIAVMNFAAYIQVGESVRAPLKYYRNNLEGLLSLVAAMRRHAVPSLVFSSTAAVYGDPAEVPIPERHPLVPLNPYGSSKLMGERILADEATTGGFESVALRYFNAAGADPEATIGEAHVPETHLIPLAIRAARDPDFTLDVFGRDFDTRDRTAVRDYIHVDDLASAHVAALDYLRAGGRTTSLNVGTGQGASVQEVIDTCAQVLGQAPKYRDAPRRAGDSPQLVADPRRARELLDWQPLSSDLQTIVETAAAWDSKLHGR
jgi:UDP-arabinose 4-epimerase